jgi:hypothetical protein
MRSTKEKPDDRTSEAARLLAKEKYGDKVCPYITQCLGIARKKLRVIQEVVSGESGAKSDYLPVRRDIWRRL